MISAKNGDIKLRFGKYKGKTLKEVPEDYLEWCINNKVLRGRAMDYALEKLGIVVEYIIEVEGSTNDKDGIYTVKINSFRDTRAIQECKREFKIAITQSFHGTLFSVKDKRYIRN